jgi:hypothetical protein
VLKESSSPPSPSTLAAIWQMFMTHEHYTALDRLGQLVMLLPRQFPAPGAQSFGRLQRRHRFGLAGLIRLPLQPEQGFIVQTSAIFPGVLL